MAKLDAEKARESLETLAKEASEAVTPMDRKIYIENMLAAENVLALIEIREAIEENTRTIQSELARMQENLIPRS